MATMRQVRAGFSAQDAIRNARRRIRNLAEQGFTVGEITALFRGLSELEHEFVWRLARDETRRARGERPTSR
jgi:hypothetical protein